MAASGSPSAVAKPAWFDKGASAALSHGGFALWVQAVSAFALQPFPADTPAWSLLALPFAQPTTWLVMLLLVALAIVLRAGKAGVVFYFVVLTALNLILVLDQLVFSRFFQHFSVDLLDDPVSPLVFVIILLADAGVATAASLAGLGLVSFYLLRMLWRDDVPRVIGLGAALGRPLPWIVLVSVVVLNAAAANWLKLYQLNWHPAVASLWQWRIEHESPWRRPVPGNVSALRYGTPQGVSDPLTDYLRNPPVPLMEGLPRRMLIVDAGAVGVPPDAFAAVAQQHGGFNRLLAAGVLFERFLHGRGEIMARFGNGDLVPGYRASKLELSQSLAPGQSCMNSIEASAVVEQWWARQIDVPGSALALVDLSVVPVCGEESRLEFVSAVVGRLDILNREAGDVSQTVLFVAGHFEPAPARFSGLTTELLDGFALGTFPDRLGLALTTPRQANVDDLLQTISAMAGAGSDSGRDMLAPAWSEQLMYFAHGTPRLTHWSVIDGEWKYAASVAGGEQSLFHLDQDPLEQNDLAQFFPNRLRLYNQLLGVWYARLGAQRIAPGDEFVEFDGQWWRAADIEVPGPKFLRVGYLEEREDGAQLHWANRFNPREPVFAAIRAQPSDEPGTITIQWLSPGLEPGYHTLAIDAGWQGSFIIPSYGLPMAEGRWQMRVTGSPGGTAFLAEDFWVDSQVPLRTAIAAKAPDLIAATVGYLADPSASPETSFVAANHLTAQQRAAVQLDWGNQQQLSFVRYQWLAPDGTIYASEHGIRAQWPRTWLLMDERIPRVAGTWRVSVQDGERSLAEVGFEIRH